eukprot:793009-Alexandrium_andersonii.AAC.1
MAGHTGHHEPIRKHARGLESRRGRPAAGDGGHRGLERSGTILDPATGTSASTMEPARMARNVLHPH